MGRFRKKPIVVEAEQFLYDGPRVPGVFYPPLSEDGRTYVGDAYVVTIHGEVAHLCNGDWVIAEPNGQNYYPCKNDIFCATYEPEHKPEAHTVDEDFEHFLNYSGFALTETIETIAKLRTAFEAAWKD